MLLSKIGEEFRELNEIIGNKRLFKSYKKIFIDIDDQKDILISWSSDMRYLSKTEGILENKNFVSMIVHTYACKYIECIEKIFTYYDNLINEMTTTKLRSLETDQWIEELYYNINELKIILSTIKMACDMVLEITGETWEPLPNDEEEKNVQNIIISSESRSMSLNDVASDIGNLDSFFKNVCQLIKQDQNQSNNIYLRRVETGSLVVAVSCAMQVAPIIAFIFWCVKLYQKAEKRYLDNADNKLKVINDSLNIAKEILKVDPDNKEADEIIQKCGVSVLNFLQNNPMGTINGEHYDIGMEKLKIEKKEKAEEQ